VGVAPFCHDSGLKKGKRTTWGGRTQVRSILYMAALSAVQYNPPLKAFYNRLLMKGKTKKSPLVACMRKLLTVANSMLRNNTEWNPNHGKLAWFITQLLSLRRGLVLRKMCTLISSSRRGSKIDFRLILFLRRWCINKLMALIPFTPIVSRQSCPYPNRNRHAQIGHDIQRSDTCMHLGDLGFK